eukprot:2312778-Pyramimonas_sp.AAC.1
MPKGAANQNAAHQNMPERANESRLRPCCWGWGQHITSRSLGGGMVLWTPWRPICGATGGVPDHPREAETGCWGAHRGTTQKIGGRIDNSPVAERLNKGLMAAPDGATEAEAVAGWVTQPDTWIRRGMTRARLAPLLTRAGRA